MKVKCLKVFAKIKSPERFFVLGEGLSRIKGLVGVLDICILQIGFKLCPN
jgi:hypothetical protein